MTALRRKEPIARLLYRADMQLEQLASGSIRATDLPNVRLTVSAADRFYYPDCMVLTVEGTNLVGFPPFKIGPHISAARARVLAYHLLRHALLLERGAAGIRQVDLDYRMERLRRKQELDSVYRGTENERED